MGRTADAAHEPHANGAVASAAGYSAAQVAPRFLNETVTLDVGRPVRSPNKTTIPLSWRATGAPGLFPVMNADLIIARLGPDMAQLGFSGSYEAPGGTIGQAIDQALLHRIAESSVKTFVDRIAEAVGNQPEQAAG